MLGYMSSNMAWSGSRASCTHRVDARGFKTRWGHAARAEEAVAGQWFAAKKAGRHQCITTPLVAEAEDSRATVATGRD